MEFLMSIYAHYGKIFGAIITRVFVDVMDYLVILKLPAQNPLGNAAVDVHSIALTMLLLELLHCKINTEDNPDLFRYQL